MVAYDPDKVEKEVLKFWDKNNIYQKQKDKYEDSDKRWSFIDGPITANNPMGVHHAWARSLKDLYLRYKAMQGYKLRRQNGFDCQGLWVEVEVEKEEGFKSRKDIEEYGIKNFVEDCKQRVLKMADKITEQSIRLGQWMDWDDSYYTMSDKSNEYKWHFLKYCHEKGWLYKGKDVVPWCPRCGTASSKHAISTEGYKQVKDKAIFMKFPVKGKDNEYFLVWTTTPWTVAANVAVAVHPDLYYVKVKIGNEFYYLAKDRLEVLDENYEVKDEILGTNLEGQMYEMPYEDLKAQEEASHPVISWDEVSAEEGTGVVHIAPGCGPEDYQLGKKHRLPAISPLNEEGVYEKGYDWLTGMKASEANPKVIEDLKKRGFLYRIEDYSHRYPHCFRCDTPLVFRMVPEWYIKVDEIRDEIIENNRKVTWVPEFAEKREEDWLKNMDDWLISRERYWGLPLPIWECECGHFEVIGSKEELKEKAVEGFDELKELHRPWVDKVKVKCPKCGKKVERVEDTGDVWLDAGTVSFSTLNYLTDKEYFDKWHPADFITEGPDQYRGWYYSMLLHGTALTGESPFKSALVHGMVKDEKGKEMHKSWGNAIWFDEAIEKSGADIMRWLYYSQDPSQELRFGFNNLEEKRKQLNVLWNFANYLDIYLDFSGKLESPKKLDTRSKWLLSRVENLKKKVVKSLEEYQPHEAAQAIEDFFLEDLSRSYGQWIREELSMDENKEIITYTLRYAFLELLKLLAPFVPFISEKLYQETFREAEDRESIHLFDWPEVQESLIDNDLEREMKIVREVSSSALAAREKANRAVRWPLAKVSIRTRDEKVKKAINKHEDLLKYIVNCLELETIQEVEGMNYEIRGDYSKLGPKFKDNVTEVIRKISEQSPQSVMRKLKEKGKFELNLSDGDRAEVLQSELIIEERLPENIVGEKADSYTVYLDLSETDRVKEYGFSREITRRVQSLRKEAGLDKPDRISLTISAPGPVISKIENQVENMKTKVGASEIELGKGIENKEVKDSFQVKDFKIELGFNIEE